MIRIGKLSGAQSVYQVKVLLGEHHVLACGGVAHRAPELRIFALPATHGYTHMSHITVNSILIYTTCTYNWVTRCDSGGTK